MDRDVPMGIEEEAPTNVSEELKALTEKALDANKAHQYALTKYAERLTAELQELERLMSAVTTDDVDEEPDIEIQVPGAKKAMGPCSISEFLNPESPFFEHASRRSQYLNYRVDHPMKAKELDVLAEAVKSENLRLRAYESQKSIQEASTAFDVENNTEGINWTTVAEKVSNVCTVKRTADQCRIRWLGDRHPKINHASWSSAELEKLKGLVTKQQAANDGKVDWVHVAKDLGTNRTPIDCMRRGLPRERHIWHPSADEKLAEAVKLYGTDNWGIVARFVSEDATAGQCQVRYTRAINPSRKRGPWADDEFERLKVAVAAYGNSWVEVAACIPGRSNEQCRERWAEHLSLSTANIVWSETDDKALMDAASSMGNKWTAISSKIGNKATGHQCRARWEKLKRLQELQQSAAADPSSIASTSQVSAAPTPKGRPRKYVAASGTGDSETTPPPVPRARPKPRPIGKGKGKEKAVELPSDVSRGPSVTPAAADASDGRTNTPERKDSELATNPRKRAADDAIDQAPFKKKRKTAKAGQGAADPNALESSTPTSDTANTRTSPRRKVGRPRKNISQSTTTAATISADEMVGAPPRPKPRPKKVIQPTEPDTSPEAPLIEDAHRPPGHSEPGSSSIIPSPEAANLEAETATAAMPKPRPRGRPRKAVPPPQLSPEPEPEVAVSPATVHVPAPGPEELTSASSTAPVPRSGGRGRGRARGRGKGGGRPEVITTITTGDNVTASRRQSARVAATRSTPRVERSDDESSGHEITNVEKRRGATEDLDFEPEVSLSDVDAEADAQSGNR
ncbi:hypothetical protein FPV67DRAFT_1664441 [Lyophyllum atratum]|nr:hypothetical protein FPV67DRAFT_1664441 [Lyophyllum atratum]